MIENVEPSTPTNSSAKVGLGSLLKHDSPLKNIISFGSAIIPAIGILLVYSYIARVQFFPSGLSLTDGVLFVFTALAGATLIFILLLFGSILNYWFFYALDHFAKKTSTKWRMHKRLKSGWLLALSILLLIAIPFLFLNATNPQKELIFGVVASGFWLNIALLADHESEFFKDQTKFSPTITTLICGSFALAILMLYSFPPFIDATMRAIGVRQNSVFVALGKDGQSIVKNITGALGVTPIACPMKAGEDYQLVKADVLWPGIGSRSLLAIHDKDSAVPPISIELESAQFKPVRGRTDCALDSVPALSPATSRP